MNNKVLFIVEGESDEVGFLNQLYKKCFGNREYDIYSYKTNIHTLAQILFNEYPEFDQDDIDIQLVLKSKEEDEDKRKILAQRYSDVYLIFDFEPQHDHTHFDTLMRMITFFNDSTDHGKLYINYPMISYLYEHYSEYPHISASYQDMLQRRIAVIRSYERQRRDELGVRVMSGNPVSSITENMACENSEIADIVVSGYLPAGVIHDLEDQREIRLGLHEMQIMQREYEAFNAALMGNLDGEELGIFMSHIRREKTMEKMAQEFGVERDSVKKRIYRIKVKLVNILLEEFKEIA